QALQEEMTDGIMVIVAQRVSTIMDADMILVLEAGQVVGKGTHKELLENNKTYQEIVHSQLREEDLG
ncbi:MAG: ABC transporter ATP-binding protein, partial [Tetragenococcus koreensis]